MHKEYSSVHISEIPNLIQTQINRTDAWQAKALRCVLRIKASMISHIWWILLLIMIAPVLAYIIQILTMMD